MSLNTPQDWHDWWLVNWRPSWVDDDDLEPRHFRDVLGIVNFWSWFHLLQARYKGCEVTRKPVHPVYAVGYPAYYGRNITNERIAPWPYHLNEGALTDHCYVQYGPCNESCRTYSEFPEAFHQEVIEHGEDRPDC